MLKEKLSKLINVKSIVTILLTIVFAILSLKGTITSQQFLEIFMMITAFYFGVQSEKKNADSKGE